VKWKDLNEVLWCGGWCVVEEVFPEFSELLVKFEENRSESVFAGVLVDLAEMLSGEFNEGVIEPFCKVKIRTWVSEFSRTLREVLLVYLVNLFPDVFGAGVVEKVPFDRELESRLFDVYCEMFDDECYDFFMGKMSEEMPFALMYNFMFGMKSQGVRFDDIISVLCLDEESVERVRFLFE
jgi:hypothetical protein